MKIVELAKHFDIPIQIFAQSNNFTKEQIFLTLKKWDKIWAILFIFTKQSFKSTQSQTRESVYYLFKNSNFPEKALCFCFFFSSYQWISEFSYTYWKKIMKWTILLPESRQIITFLGYFSLFRIHFSSACLFLRHRHEVRLFFVCFFFFIFCKRSCVPVTHITTSLSIAILLLIHCVYL